MKYPDAAGAVDAALATIAGATIAEDTQIPARLYSAINHRKARRYYQNKPVTEGTQTIPNSLVNGLSVRGDFIRADEVRS